MTKSVAVDAAHDLQGGDVITLSTGIQARLTPVATGLLDDVQARIKEPKVPMWKNPEKEGAEEENYNDPAYLDAVTEARRKRGEAMMDAMLLFGVELLDPVPPDEEWLPKLRMMAKRGMLPLDDYNTEDPVEKEFIYKRWIAVAATDYRKLTELCGLTAAGVEAAEDSFRNQ